jgi:vancomycin resistance protein YoaR
MARSAKATPKTTAKKAAKVKPAVKITRAKPAAKIAAKKPAKTVKPAAAKPPAARRKPIVAQDELRASIEKLEMADTTLRTKIRELTKALKAAEIRIAALESAGDSLPEITNPVVKKIAVSSEPAPVEP